MGKKKVTRKVKVSGAKKKPTAGPVDAVGFAKKKRHLYLLEKVRSEKGLNPREQVELARYEQAESGEEGSGIDEQVVVGQLKAAEFLGVSDRTIRRYEKAGMPVGALEGDKLYWKQLLLDWKENEGREDNPDRQRRAKAEADLVEKKVVLLERKLAEQEAEFGGRLEAELVQRVAVLKAGLTGVVRRTVRRMPKKEQRRLEILLKEEFRNLCNGYAGKARGQ